MLIDTIICGDCAEILKAFPNSCIDLTVTSPPYDNLRDYNGYMFRFEEIAQELYRIMKNGSVVVWVVGDATIAGSETGTSFKQALFFKEIGFRLHDTMIYEKKGVPYPSRNRYHQVFEYMFVFVKGKLLVFNPVVQKENKWAGFSHWGKQTHRLKDGSLNEWNTNSVIKKFGMSGNIWTYAVGRGNSTKDSIAFNTPAIFPEQLASDHILSWSNEEDLVLDPFVGSGTVAKMAKVNKRHFIGIDISLEYCNIARKRCGIE